MPDREVQTVRDLIFYQYAKIIARATMKETDGRSAKKHHYGFIKNTFRKLRSGEMSWSDITREDWQLVISGEVCAYCGSTEELQREHIIRKTILIKPECSRCDKIQTIHNQVLACRRCNAAKGTAGLYTFYEKRFPEEKKFYDILPPLVEKKYLKVAYCCHECAGTLDAVDVNGDGRIDVFDIDYVFSKHFQKNRGK